MNRQTFLRSFAVAALSLTAVACTTDAGDPLTASDPGPAPAATAPAGATSGAQGSTATDSAPQEITIVTLDSMRFEPATLTVVAGRPVRLTVRNGGNGEHDFTLSRGAARPVTIAVKPGQSNSATFTVARPGTYPFVCSVFGHALAGMTGTITATAA
jgi:nitrite reductase (NO-forming)